MAESLLKAGRSSFVPSCLLEITSKAFRAQWQMAVMNRAWRVNRGSRTMLMKAGKMKYNGFKATWGRESRLYSSVPLRWRRQQQPLAGGRGSSRRWAFSRSLTTYTFRETSRGAGGGRGTSETQGTIRIPSFPFHHLRLLNRRRREQGAGIQMALFCKTYNVS